MREWIRQIVEEYRSVKLEGQEGGFVLFSGQEADTRVPVWIKILPQALGRDAQLAARFKALAQAIRQLNHPNIAPIRLVGEKAGLPYVVSRAVEKAQPLAAKMDQPWAVDLAADVVMQVGQALEYAANKGLVHGSLSPQNIAVQADGKVLVTDFGLAQLLDLVGVRIKESVSPFLAPERTAGKLAAAPADVYSLGAILYSLLAKRPPEVVHGQVLPPSRFNPEVPAEMDRVVLKALDPNPADRYPTVKLLLAALGAVSLASLAQPQPAKAATGELRCRRCGALNPPGRFCRKCGARLQQPGPSAPATPPRSKDEPILITKIEVGHLEIGKGIEIHETTIARPMPVATEDLAAQFPEPLEMPRLEGLGLWPTADGQPLVAMPEPPPMPTVDWATIAPAMPEIPVIQDLFDDIGKEEDSTTTA